MAEDALRYWHALSTVEAERLAEQDPVAILPLAAIEQHGPHLPLSTDLDIGMGLLAAAFGRLPPDFPAWVLPPQSVGSSREHARYAGTLSVDGELLVRMIEQVGEGVARCGVQRLVLCNSHAGNRDVLEAAGLRLREQRRMLVVKASWSSFPRPDEVELPESEWRHGWHGGAVETAMMMHLRPELVRAAEVRDAPSLGAELEAADSRITPEGEVPFSWLVGDLNRSGSVGDARRANARLGERLVSHYGGVLAEVIRDARAFPLDRLT